MSDEFAPPLQPSRAEDLELWDESTLWEEGPPREPGAPRRVGAPAPGQVRLTLRIRRYNREVRQDPWWDEFAVNMEPTDRLLDALHVVKWYHDGSLSLRRSCAHGICGSDAMLINGRNALACKILLRDVAPNVTVEPIRCLPDQDLARQRVSSVDEHRV